VRNKILAVNIELVRIEEKVVMTYFSVTTKENHKKISVRIHTYLLTYLLTYSLTHSMVQDIL